MGKDNKADDEVPALRKHQRRSVSSFNGVEEYYNSIITNNVLIYNKIEEKAPVLNDHIKFYTLDIVQKDVQKSTESYFETYKGPMEVKAAGKLALMSQQKDKTSASPTRKSGFAGRGNPGDGNSSDDSDDNDHNNSGDSSGGGGDGDRGGGGDGDRGGGGDGDRGGGGDGDRGGHRHGDINNKGDNHCALITFFSLLTVMVVESVVIGWVLLQIGSNINSGYHGRLNSVLCNRTGTMWNLESSFNDTLIIFPELFHQYATTSTTFGIWQHEAYVAIDGHADSCKACSLTVNKNILFSTTDLPEMDITFKNITTSALVECLPKYQILHNHSSSLRILQETQRSYIMVKLHMQQLHVLVFNCQEARILKTAIHIQLIKIEYVPCIPQKHMSTQHFQLMLPQLTTTVSWNMTSNCQAQDRDSSMIYKCQAKHHASANFTSDLLYLYSLTTEQNYRNASFDYSSTLEVYTNNATGESPHEGDRSNFTQLEVRAEIQQSEMSSNISNSCWLLQSNNYSTDYNTQNNNTKLSMYSANLQHHTASFTGANTTTWRSSQMSHTTGGITKKQIYAVISKRRLNNSTLVSICQLIVVFTDNWYAYRPRCIVRIKPLELSTTTCKLSTLNGYQQETLKIDYEQPLQPHSRLHQTMLPIQLLYNSTKKSKFSCCDTIVNAVSTNHNDVSVANYTITNNISQSTWMHGNTERTTQRSAEHEVQHDQKTTTTNVTAESAHERVINQNLTYVESFTAELVEFHYLQPEGLSEILNYQEFCKLHYLMPSTLFKCNCDMNLSTWQLESLPHPELPVYSTKALANLMLWHSLDFHTKLEYNNNSIDCMLEDDGAITLLATESTLTNTTICLQSISHRQLRKRTAFETSKVLCWFNVQFNYMRLVVCLQHMDKVSLVREDTVWHFCKVNMLYCYQYFVPPLPTQSYNEYSCIITLCQNATPGDLHMLQCICVNGAAYQNLVFNTTASTNYKDVSVANCTITNNISQSTWLHGNKERTTQRYAKHEAQHAMKAIVNAESAHESVTNMNLNCKDGFTNELVDSHSLQVQLFAIPNYWGFSELHYLMPSTLFECNSDMNLSTLQMESPPHLELLAYLTKVIVNLTLWHNIDNPTELEHHNRVYFVLEDNGAVDNITVLATDIPESTLTNTTICLQSISHRKLYERTTLETSESFWWFNVQVNYTRLICLQYSSPAREKIVWNFCNVNIWYCYQCCVSLPTQSYNEHLCTITFFHQNTTRGEIPDPNLFFINGATYQLVCKYREMDAIGGLINASCYRECSDNFDPICSHYCKAALKTNAKIDIHEKLQIRNISWGLYNCIPVLVHSIQFSSVGVRCNNTTINCCCKYCLCHTMLSDCRGLVVEWNLCIETPNTVMLQVILTHCCKHSAINTSFLSSLVNLPVLQCDLTHYQYCATINGDYSMTILQTQDHANYSKPVEKLKTPITHCIFNNAMLSRMASQSWLVQHQSNRFVVNSLYSCNTRVLRCGDLCECKLQTQSWKSICFINCDEAPVKLNFTTTVLNYCSTVFQLNKTALL